MANKMLKKPLNKTKNTRLAVVITIITLIIVTGVTFAFLIFQGGEQIPLNIGKVELNIVVNATSNITNIVPGENIVESSSFSKTANSEKCYVRAYFDFYSESTSLTRQEKNYILFLNAYDNSSNISTGVNGTKWLNVHDNYYYLVDNNNQLIVVDDTTSYNFASNIPLPLPYEIMKEGLEVDTNVPSLFLDVKFQAIQSEYLPANTLEEVAEIFNVCFKTITKDEYLIRFNTGDDVKVVPQVVKAGEKVVKPSVISSSGAPVRSWYIDEALRTEFNFNTGINKSLMLYVEWDLPELITEGLIFIDDVLVGYVGDSERVVVPALYSATGERVQFTKTATSMYAMAGELYKIMYPMELGYNLYPMVITDGIKTYKILNSDEINYVDIESLNYPVTISYYVDKYEYGTTSVTTIGECALGDICEYFFKNAGLNVYIPTAEVKEIIISEGITTLSAGAFMYQNINSIQLPSTLTTIDSRAFENSRILSLVIPASVTSIESDVFTDSTIFEFLNLSSVEIDTSSISDVAIMTDLSQSNIYKYAQEEYTIYATDIEGLSAILGVTTFSKNIVLPDAAVTLYNIYDESRTITLGANCLYNALQMNDNIKQLVISDDTIAIMDYEFAGCSNLEMITFNGSEFEYLGEELFEECNNLKYVLLQNNSGMVSAFNGYPVYTIQTSGYDAITFEVSDTLVDFATGIDASGNNWVRTGRVSGEYKFYKEFAPTISFSEGLYIVNGEVQGYFGTDKQVVIPETYSTYKMKVEVMYIEVMTNSYDYEFQFPLKTYIGDNVYTVNSEEELEYIFEILEKEITFFDLLSIKFEFYLPIAVDGDEYIVTSISTNSFAGHGNIVSVTIPSTVTTCTANFNDCSSLVEVINYSSVSIGFTNVITDVANSKLTKTQDGFIFANYSGEYLLVGYDGFEQDIVLPDSFNGGGYKIADYAFAYFFKAGMNDNVVSLTIPSCVTYVNSSFLFHSTSIRRVNFNATNAADADNINYGWDIFHALIVYNHPGVEVVIGANVTRIPANLFDTWIHLKSVTFEEGSVCSYIGKNAFYDCVKLSNIVIPSSMTEIAEGAFESCTGLMEVVNKSSLNIVKGEATNGRVAYYAESVSTNSNISIVGDFKFYNGGTGKMYLLQYLGEEISIDLPSNFNGVNYAIYSYAFTMDSRLVNINIPEGVIGICDSAFEYCIALKSINLPSTLTSIGAYAFAYCYEVSVINYNTNNIADFTAAHSAFNNVGGCVNGGVTINIGANVTRIPAHLFHSNNYEAGMDDIPTYKKFIIKSVKFEEGSQCTSIGTYAFYFDDSNTDYAPRGVLQSMEIPSTITSIGTSAFCSDSIQNTYALCGSSSVVSLATSAGFTRIYVRDTTTDFSNIPFISDNTYGDVTGIYISGSVDYYVKTGYGNNTKYYTINQ